MFFHSFSGSFHLSVDLYIHPSVHGCIHLYVRPFVSSSISSFTELIVVILVLPFFFFSIPHLRLSHPFLRCPRLPQPALLKIVRRPHPVIFNSSLIYCSMCAFMLGKKNRGKEKKNRRHQDIIGQEPRFLHPFCFLFYPRI